MLLSELLSFFCLHSLTAVTEINMSGKTCGSSRTLRPRVHVDSESVRSAGFGGSYEKKKVLQLIIHDNFVK